MLSNHSFASPFCLHWEIFAAACVTWPEPGKNSWTWTGPGAPVEATSLWMLF